MIEHPAESDLAELKSLWKEAFGDTDEFIEGFFTRRYSPGSALVYRSGYSIASMIFFPHYEFSIEGKACGLGYICGAATRKDFRGRGMMGELVGASHKVIGGRGDWFAALIPASDSLYEYYRRFGYRELFFRTRLRITRGGVRVTPGYSLLPASDFDHIYNIYSRGIRSLNAAVVHSRESYSSVAEDFRLSGGEILAGSDGNLYTFVRINGTVVSVRETFARLTHDSIYQELAAALLDYYKVADCVDIEAPAGYAGAGAEGFRTGMGIGLTDESRQMLSHIPGAYMKFMLEE